MMTSQKATPTVYVIDDDHAVRQSLQWLIESVGIEVQTFESASALLDRPGPIEAGCLVVDVRLPGMSGLDLQDRLREMGCGAPIIIITGHGDVPVAIRAMKAGAFDFIEKPFSDQTLLDRIREALDHEEDRRTHATWVGRVTGWYQSLSPRETQVMALVVQGHLNKQIAGELGLSHKTIEVHRAHVMEKMHAKSLADLVRMAVMLEQSATV